MATLTSSFVSDVVDSLFDKFTTDLGVGSSVYPDNAYLQVKTVERAGGWAQLSVSDDETPALWVEYIAGGDEQHRLGSPHGTMFEGFNIYLYAVFDPETLEMANRDLSDFRKYAEIALDALMRRTIKAIDEWSGSVTDSVLLGQTNGAKTDVWSFVMTARNNLQVEGRVLIRAEVKVE